jgi:hypothetical protein
MCIVWAPGWSDFVTFSHILGWSPHSQINDAEHFNSRKRQRPCDNAPHRPYNPDRDLSAWPSISAFQVRKENLTTLSTSIGIARTGNLEQVIKLAVFATLILVT